MACKKVKDDKEKLKNDPFINDPRYTALPLPVRELFQGYLQRNKDGSLTDFLAKRKAITQKTEEKGAAIKGKRIIETSPTGAIVTRILNKDGEIE